MGMTLDRNGAPGFRGILADVGRLDTWLDGAFVALTVASVLRYLNGHGFNDRAPLIVAAAVALTIVYAVVPRLVPLRTNRRADLWCAGLLLMWFVLVVLAPSFSWVAVPLSFVALRVFPFGPACVAVATMTVTVIAAWTAMQGVIDPTIIAGPVSVAGLAVGASRLLEREASSRRQILDELEQAQGELADTQHRAGVLAERSRLSREIHDSVAQRLSSINLLCQAADQHWTTRPADARQYITQAALTSRGGLDEVRRVVRDLAPKDLADDHSGSALPVALKQDCDQLANDSALRIDVRIDGEPVSVAPDISTAVLRTARGALANVIEHANATTATVSLTYQPGSIALDVCDNGIGFRTDHVALNDDRGRGLAGMRNRANDFGGTLAVETAPDEGTTIAVTLPLSGPQ